MSPLTHDPSMMEETDFTGQFEVFILSRALDAGERVEWLGISAEKLSLLRRAQLLATTTTLSLAEPQTGRILRSLERNKIVRATYAPGVITRSRQFLKPALAGLLTAAIVPVAAYLFGNREFTGDMILRAFSILGILLPVLFIYGARANISSENLGVVSFTDVSGRELQCAVSESHLPDVLKVAAVRGLSPVLVQREDLPGEAAGSDLPAKIFLGPRTLWFGRIRISRAHRAGAVIAATLGLFAVTGGMSITTGRGGYLLTLLLVSMAAVRILAYVLHCRHCGMIVPFLSDWSPDSDRSKD